MELSVAHAQVGIVEAGVGGILEVAKREVSA